MENWVGIVPLIVGFVGLFFVKRIVAWVEAYEPQLAIEPKSRVGKTWVKWAGLAGEGPGWHRARIGFTIVVFGGFAVLGVLS